MPRALESAVPVKVLVEIEDDDALDDERRHRHPEAVQPLFWAMVDPLT
jgi:hypothetical protein